MPENGIDAEVQARFNATRRRFDELYGCLIKDVHVALKRATDEPNEFNKRVAVRVVFSAIEGIVYLLKDQVMAGADPEDGDYSHAEISLMREEAYQLDDRGNTVIRPNFLRPRDNLLFSWKMFFRNTLPAFTPDLSGDGWRCFLSSLTLRNRLTHPRSGADLEVSDQDMVDLETAFEWVHETTFQNIARALLRVRSDHYDGLNRILPERTLRCLDALYVVRKNALDAMKDRVDDFLLDNGCLESGDLGPLMTNHLVQMKDDGSVFLTADCVLYIKWRADGN